MNGRTVKLLRKYSHKIGVTTPNQRRKIKKAWNMMNHKKRTIERPKIIKVVSAK